MTDKKILIPYPGGNCHPSLFEVKESLLSEVVDFVIESCGYLICDHYVSEQDVIVCIPNYIADLIKEKFFEDNTDLDGNLMIAGFKTQISYENKVTVFYNAYLPQEIIKYTKQL